MSDTHDSDLHAYLSQPEGEDTEQQELMDTELEYMIHMRVAEMHERLDSPKSAMTLYGFRQRYLALIQIAVDNKLPECVQELKNNYTIIFK